MRCTDTIRTLLTISLLSCLVGCGGGGEASPETQAAVTVDDAAVAAMLAKADAVDGTEDQVVASCAGCALAMDGSADHALTVDEYEMYFCSDDCKKKFAENPAESVLALKIQE